MVNQIDAVIEKEEQLKNYTGDDAVIFNADLLDEIITRKQKSPTVFMQSGIPAMDECMKGFYGGELTIISGPTKNGKTTFARTLTKNFHDQDKRVLWFSFEEREEKFLSRFDEPLPVFVLPRKLKQNDVEWIYERIYEAVLKYGIDCAFLDNTHNIVNLAVKNATHILDEFIKRISFIAKELNLAIFLMHHIIKGEIRQGESIGSHLLRDSSMFAQTADNVIFIWRTREDSEEGMLKITENREHGVWNKKIPLIKRGYYFYEMQGVDSWTL